MDKVQQAIAAQRKRRADIQSAYDAKKSSAIQKRKTSLQPKQTTKLGTGTGAGIMKYAGENYQQTGIKKAIRETSNYTRTDLLAKARAEESRSAVKAAPKGPSVAPARTYTEKEKQINALLMTGKKKNGTLKASAQRKIQRIRKK